MNTHDRNEAVPAGTPPHNQTKGEAGDIWPAVPDEGQAGPKVLVLGLGNDILCDDAVGLKVAQQIRSQCDPAEVAVIECCEMGLSLLDHLVGYERVAVVDAVQTGQAPSGFVHELESDDIKILPRMSPHFFGIGEALVLGRQLGMAMPSQVKIFAIEVADPFTVTTKMTPAIEQALPAIVAQIMAVVRPMIRPDQAKQPPRGS